MDWYYQGRQTTRPLLYTAITTKLTFIFFVIFLVDGLTYNDVFFAFALIFCAGNVVLCILSGCFKKIATKGLVNYSLILLSHARLFFSAKIAIEIYKTFPTIVLGIFSTPVNVSYFVIAEKVITAIQSLQLPVGKALLPRAVEKIRQLGPLGYLDAFQKLYRMMLIIYFAVFILINLFAKNIVDFFSSEGLSQITLNFHLLSVLLLVGSSSYLIGMAGLIPLGRNAYYTKVLVYVATASLIYMVPAVYFFSDFGAVVAVIFSELMIFILFARKIFKRN